MSTAADSGDHGPTPGGSETGRHAVDADAGSGDTAPHKAGAFDIRVFIASLIGIYGLVLTIAGLLGPSAGDLAKAGGVNINLWAGLGMILVAAGFVVWARMRPVVVPADVESQDGPPAGH
jgi:hypothetical protein